MRLFNWLFVLLVVTVFGLETNAGTTAAPYSNVMSYIFGYAGSSGSTGQSGYDGRNGASVEIQATGQAEYLDLRASDGNDGSDGGEGYDASNCYQSCGTSDLEGAPGGEGGDGGRAGNGGNGGSLRAYFTDIANLKKVVVDSTPGRPGYAGSGARGGRACQCSTYSWRERVCRQYKRDVTTCTPAGCNPRDQGCRCTTREEWYESCEYETFSCHDGRDGREGSMGSRGSEGSLGQIQLVKRLEPLEDTSPSLSPPVESLLGQDFMLTRHDWDSKQGAVTLFGPGSRVRNEYALYAGKTIRTVSFNWLDKVRDVEYYRGERLSLSLSGRPASVDIDFPSNLLADVRTETKVDHTVVNVLKTMKRSELTQLRVDEMYGSNESLNLVLIDDAKVSDVTKTKIYIKSGWDLEGDGEFKAWVPDELIVSELGKITINLGRLPNIKASKRQKYFGDKCEFEMQVVREFAGNSDQFAQGKDNILDIEKEVKKNKPIKVKWKD